MAAPIKTYFYIPSDVFQEIAKTNITKIEFNESPNTNRDASLPFGFLNSLGEEEQWENHARDLLSRTDAQEVVPSRRHSLYSGPFSKDEFVEAVLERELTAEEETIFTNVCFSAAPRCSLGSVLVAGAIERSSLLLLADLARIHGIAPETADSESTTQSAYHPTRNEVPPVTESMSLNARYYGSKRN